jgi:hypothetical protein
MSGVGKLSRARRVDSIVLEATTTAVPGVIGRNFVWPFTTASMPVTAEEDVWRRVTWQRGTRKSRRVRSGFAAASRIASVRIGALENLSKLKRPEAGEFPWTASGAFSI